MHIQHVHANMMPAYEQVAEAVTFSQAGRPPSRIVPVSRAECNGCAGRAGSTFGDPEAAAQGDTSAGTQLKKSAGDASEGLTRAVSDAGGQVLPRLSGFRFLDTWMCKFCILSQH